jgi:hypothetical protein
MEYSGEGVSVYAEAKGEYTRQLCQYLTPALQKYFLDLLALAKERETDPKKHLVTFQTLLEGISEWNVDKVQRETQALAMSTQCDYLEELLTAVFIAHTKVLSAIRLTNRQKKLQITIPKLEHFLHRTMTECARLLWSNTFLFATTGAALERQKNMRQIESLITEGVLQGVRGMLPVKSILREYLAADESEEEAEEGGEEETEEGAEEGAEEEETAAVPETLDAPAIQDGPATTEAVPDGILQEEAVIASPSAVETVSDVADTNKAPSIPTIVLDTVLDTVLETDKGSAATPVKESIVSENELIDMDDIPLNPDELVDSSVPPLSIEDGGIEFEEL